MAAVSLHHENILARLPASLLEEMRNKEKRERTSNGHQLLTPVGEEGERESCLHNYNYVWGNERGEKKFRNEFLAVHAFIEDRRLGKLTGDDRQKRFQLLQQPQQTKKYSSLPFSPKYSAASAEMKSLKFPMVFHSAKQNGYF